MRRLRRAVPLALAATLALCAAPALAEDRNMYVELKGGGYFPTANNAGDAIGLATSGTLPTGGDFELALGSTWGILGAQLSAGYMFTSNSGVGLTGIPISAVIQVRLPLFFIVPYLEVGAGAFISSAKSESTSQTDTKVSFMVPAGGGVDVYLGPVLLGVEARYLYVSPQTYTWGTLPPTDIKMSGVVLTANVGYRF